MITITIIVASTTTIEHMDSSVCGEHRRSLTSLTPPRARPAAHFMVDPPWSWRRTLRVSMGKAVASDRDQQTGWGGGGECTGVSVVVLLCVSGDGGGNDGSGGDSNASYRSRRRCSPPRTAAVLVVANFASGESFTRLVGMGAYDAPPSSEWLTSGLRWGDHHAPSLDEVMGQPRLTGRLEFTPSSLGANIESAAPRAWLALQIRNRAIWRHNSRTCSRTSV